MEDDTPIDELMVELEMGICDRYAALSPLHLRHEKAVHVFRMIAEYGDYSRKEKKKKHNGGKEVIRVKAPDTWF